MKQKFIDFIGYDKKHTKIPLSKENWWFNKRQGYSHCVVSCSNFSDVFYITDYGFARIAYCDSHAKNRILNSIITGQIERGLWCEVWKGKLRPHEYYKRYLPLFKKLYPNKAKKLQQKLKEFRVKV